MTAGEILEQFIAGMRQTGIVEYIAVFAGIASVWYSRKENILVYPTGLVNTIFYIYLSFKGGLLGEASVNFYYTIMSIYGWALWSKKDVNLQPVIKITASSKKGLGATTWILFALLRFAFLCAHLPEKQFHTRSNSLGGCICKCHCLHRHVADDEEEN